MREIILVARLANRARYRRRGIFSPEVSYSRPINLPTGDAASRVDGGRDGGRQRGIGVLRVKIDRSSKCGDVYVASNILARIVVSRAHLDRDERTPAEALSERSELRISRGNAEGPDRSRRIAPCNGDVRGA